MKNPNVLHIDTLSADWSDNDIVMLHACFALLTDCIENEKLLTGNTDWNYNDEHKKLNEEIQALYDWWKFRKDQDNEIEGQTYEKDNEMLIRLIKIRQHLWT